MNREYKNIINEAKNKNKEYENIINQMKNIKNDELELNICNIKKELEEKTKKINEYKLKENEINNMNKIIEELQKKIKKLETDNIIKEHTIRILEKNKDGVNNYKNYKNNIEENETEKMKSKIIVLQQENEKLKKSNQEKDDNFYKLNIDFNDNFYKLNIDFRKKEYKIENDLNKNMNELSKKDEEISKLEEVNQAILENHQKAINEIKNNYQNEIAVYKKKIKNLEQNEKELNNKVEEYRKKEKEFSLKNDLKNSNDNSKLQKEYNELKIKYLNLLEDTRNKKSHKNSFCNDDNEPLKCYKRPILIGLNKIGETSFMNSTLQCLSQIERLTNYFLNDKNKERIINNNIALKNKNDLQLSPAYLDLIKILWKIDGEKAYIPITFLNAVNNMNKSFKNEKDEDAKDFIIFILEQLHNELKKPVQNYSNEKLKLNQYNKNTFNFFFNDYKKESSIISDIFFGVNEKTNECCHCKKIYNKYEIFNCLIFPLEKVKNMKDINNNRISIYDCFYYNQKSEYFTGVNRNYCNACKQLYDFIYTSKIFSSPYILVLILDREKENIYDIKLDFNENIDITKFVQQKEHPNLIYNLYSVIARIDQSGPNAHFVASCKSPIDNKWYRYNDSTVISISNIQKEVIECHFNI